MRINIQKPAKTPDCLLGVVPQPTDNRLSETIYWQTLRDCPTTSGQDGRCSREADLKGAATSRSLVNRGYVRHNVFLYCF